jgi:hypothetical protein
MISSYIYMCICSLLFFSFMSARRDTSRAVGDLQIEPHVFYLFALTNFTKEEFHLRFSYENV